MKSIRSPRLKALVALFIGVTVLAFATQLIFSQSQVTNIPDSTWALTALQIDADETSRALEAIEFDTFVVSLRILLSWVSSLEQASFAPLRENWIPLPYTPVTSSPRSPPLA